ncbi:MAG: RIP metalloprotease RseP, partial [Myxococcota bacterium]
MSVLIFVHELGHFFWAKAFGVKVLTFCIGFGPKLVRLRGRETEYCLAALPLGGFVKMLEENRQDPVLPEDRHRTFDAQPVYKRAIIVLAGPAMSILFPVFLYVAVFAGEADFSPPTVGTVLPNHAAAGVLEPGDRILEVDGTRIGTFAELSRAVRKSPGRELRLKVFRDNTHVEVRITPEEHIEYRGLGLEDRVGAIGVKPRPPAAVVGIDDDRSQAYRAGLRTFDVITEVRGQPVQTFADLEALIDNNRGETTPVTYLRPVRVPRALGGLGDLHVYDSGLVALTPETRGEGITPRTGIEPADLYIADVNPNAPEYRAGIRAGDRIVSVDDVDVTTWATYRERMSVRPLTSHRVSWRRAGAAMSATFRLDEEALVADDYDARPPEPIFGAKNWPLTVPHPPVGRPSLWNYALPAAVDEMTDVIRFIAAGLREIATGKLSLSTIGGPITVYDVVMQERQ